MKLGKKPPRIDRRTLQLGKYLLAGLPPPPPSADWTGMMTDWGMMLNSDLGCCTIAAAGHAVQGWSKQRVAEITVPDSAILDYYERWDGYNPSDPSTDAGGVEIDVLNAWRRDGLFGHQLLAYAQVNPASLTHVRQAIALFGGVYIGLALPLTAQTQDVWDIVDGTQDARPGSWGGHAVWVPKYDADGDFICVTWGQLKTMTERFWVEYVEEAYALIGGDFDSPQGFDLATLQGDLVSVTG